MGTLSDLIYGVRDVLVNGVSLPRRNRVNIIGPNVAAVDNAAEARTDVTISPDAAAVTPSGTGFRFVVDGGEEAAARKVDLANAGHVDGLLGTAHGGTGVASAALAAAAGAALVATVGGELELAPLPTIPAGAAEGDPLVSDGAEGFAWEQSAAARAIGDVGLRLSLVSGDALPAADVVGASTLYLVPHLHGRITLWNGTRWRELATNEISLALAGLTAGLNYDVYAHLATSTTVALELVAWGGPTTPPARARQHGALVKSGDATRLLVGTIRATGATTTEDSAAKRFVSNLYNARPRRLRVIDDTNTWGYASANSVWRNARALAANAFEYVSCVSTWLDASAHGLVIPDSTGGAMAAVGIGVDASNVNSAHITHAAGAWRGTPVVFSPCSAVYSGEIAAGYHKINWLETGEGAISYTFAGDNGKTIAQTGMIGRVLA